MWLTGRLAPDFKTIADFRKNDGLVIRATCRRFIEVCRRLNLFAHPVTAIDGSKFKGVNGHDKNFTRGKLQKRMDQVAARLSRIMLRGRRVGVGVSREAEVAAVFEALWGRCGA
jgi:transposase